MGDAQIKSVALFFFFAFLDETQAIQATTKAIRLFRKKLKAQLGAQDNDSNIDAIIVEVTQKIWKKQTKKLSLAPSALDQYCLLPKDFDLEPWKQLQKEILPEEYLALIWSKLLDIHENQLAIGLHTTVGTVRHRISSGLRSLGKIIQLGNRHGQRA